MATVIVTDANILINLFHIGKLPLLGALDGCDFRVPPQVLQEITEPAQRDAVQGALTAGHLTEIAVESENALELYASLRDIMGRGEAACLALAATAGFHLASDEKRRFRSRARELIGEGRLLRTELLLLAAIRSGHLCVAEADECRRVLEGARYVMPFNSFAELIAQQDGGQGEGARPPTETGESLEEAVGDGAAADDGPQGVVKGASRAALDWDKDRSR